MNFGLQAPSGAWSRPSASGTMSDRESHPRCPHCEAGLKPIDMPEGTGWEGHDQWACFNDECAYYREGWDWMWENYRVRASYRYRLMDPSGGWTSPLPVWSETALKDHIVEDK